MPLRRRLTGVKLYYSGAQTIVSVFILTVAFFASDSYGVPPSTLVFLTSAYIALQFFLLKRVKSVYPPAVVRYTDYFFTLLVIFLSKNFYGAVPPLLLLAVYSFLYWKEFFSAVMFSLFLLTLKVFLFKNFANRDFLLALFYILALSLISSKINLSVLVEGAAEKLKAVRTMNLKYQKQISLLSNKIKLLEELERLVDQISHLNRTEDIEKVLRSYLNAEKIFFGEYPPLKKGWLRFTIGRLTIWIKPKYPFLLKDNHYKAKTEKVLKLLKPYLESFFANNK